MTDIIINDKSTIKSIGEHTSGNCKPVVCITDNMTFNSVTDAAEYYNAWAIQISNVCTGKFRTFRGKRFCFLRDINQHLDEMMDDSRNMAKKISELERKATLWDTYQREQEAKRKAEEERIKDAQFALERANEKLDRRKEIMECIDAQYQKAVRRMMEAEKEVHEAELALLAAEGKIKTETEK